MSHSYLVFDEAFWKENTSNGHFDWQKTSNIISNILFHHNGPIHKFYLYIPDDPIQVMNLNLSQWISFLSKTGIKKIDLVNSFVDYEIPIPSHIFACQKLVKLSISFFELITPPTNIYSINFACLRSLELLFIKFKHDIFTSFIASCPKLTTLSLGYCLGITNLVIHQLPFLQNLTVIGFFTSLSFENFFRLQKISLSLFLEANASYMEIVGAIKILATQPCELQYLQLNGHICKVNEIHSYEVFVMQFIYYSLARSLYD